MKPTTQRLFEALGRLLLPRDFHEDCGEPMAEAFADLRAEARSRGVAAEWWLFFRECASLVRTAIDERTQEWGRVDGTNRRNAFEDLRKDMAVAVRSLGKAKAYGATVILILALGVAATTAVFTVVNGLLLRPLPYPDAEELVLVWTELSASTDPTEMTVSPADFLDWREQTSGLSALAAHNLWFPVLTGGGGDASSIMAGLVTPGFFDLLGVRPQLGRLLGADDEGLPRVVLSDGLWRTRYGADPTVLGRSVVLNGLSYEVVGVLPAEYRHPDPHRPLMETQLFATFDTSEWATGNGRFLRVFGRLAEGMTVASAEAEMDAIAARLADLRPDSNADTGTRVLSMRDQFFASSRSALVLAMAGSALLFVIVCANVASLVLARSLARRREFAVRASLGAGRWRIARQLLVENGTLAMLGCVVGLVLVVLGLDAIRSLQGTVLPLLGDVRLDLSVTLFAMLLTLTMTLLLGVLPLLEFFRTPTRAVLTEESAGSGGSRRSRRMRGVLVVSEVAIAAALVVGAGLLARSFQRLSDRGPGFDAASLLTVELVAPRDRYETVEEAHTLYAALAERIGSVPGVEVISYASQLPMVDGDWSSAFEIVDRPQARQDWPTTEIRFVAPDYFRTMGIGVASGREFLASDVGSGAPVVVVNQALAERHWPSGDVVGQRVRWERGDSLVTAEIVGVVGDVLDDGLAADSEPFLYYLYQGGRNRSVAFVARTSGDPVALSASVRAAVREVDAALPVEMVQAYRSRILETISAPRTASQIAAVFSFLALGIAGLGIYGLVSYSVRSREREIGIRSALGARKGDVAGLVVRQSMALTLLGVVIGLAVAGLSGRVLASILYDTSLADPVSFLAAPTLLVVVALLASYLPARRALAVDPVRALRSESR